MFSALPSLGDIARRAHTHKTCRKPLCGSEFADREAPSFWCAAVGARDLQPKLDQAADGFGGVPEDWRSCDCAYVPTLEELIEACGFPIRLSANVKDYWYARNVDHSEATKGESSPAGALVKLACP